MTAARTGRAPLRVLLAGCLVLLLGASLTGQAYAAWRPTGAGRAAGKAAVLPVPIAVVTPQPGRTCASLGVWELRWTLATDQSFTIYQSGVLQEYGYYPEPAPKGQYKDLADVPPNSKNATFTVSYSDEKWTATSAPVGCTERPRFVW